jgi:hypothetical protein
VRGVTGVEFSWSVPDVLRQGVQLDDCANLSPPGCREAYARWSVGKDLFHVAKGLTR